MIGEIQGRQQPSCFQQIHAGCVTVFSTLLVSTKSEHEHELSVVQATDGPRIKRFFAGRN